MLRTSRPAQAPEPFPPLVATLRFALPSATECVVSVCDTQGTVVRVLMTGVLARGEHACAWDGHDDVGGRVRAGQYTLCLEVAGRELTSRRVMIG